MKTSPDLVESDSMTGQLTLRLPCLSWPYYWSIEVDRTTIRYGVKRRWMLIFTTAIDWKTTDYLSHFGELHQGVLNEMEKNARTLAEQINPRRDVLKAFRKVVILSPNTTVKVKRY